MPTPILMPALSPTMETGKLAKWLVKEGDEVSSGDLLCEIETDKATMEVEAVDEGAIGKILIADGTEDVPVNQPIALLLQEGEDAAALDGFDGSGPSPLGGEGGNDASAVLPDEGGTEGAQSSLAPYPPTGEAAGPSLSRKGRGDNTRIFASPLARRIAGQNNVDISLVAGSGPRGRIVKRDIEKALAEGVLQMLGDPALAQHLAQTARADVVNYTWDRRAERILHFLNQGTHG